MKKISILVALALIVTIGGVYATWSYNQSTMNVIEERLVVNMQDYIGSTASGHIEVIANTADIRITDNYIGNTHVGHEVQGDFIAEVETMGRIVVLFTPFANAANKNPTLQFELSVAGTLKHGETDIFTLVTAKQTCAALTKIEDQADLDTLNAMLSAEHRLNLADAQGKSYVVIDVAAWDTSGSALISMGGTFTLDTLAKYHDFQTDLTKGQLLVTISEKIS